MAQPKMRVSSGFFRSDLKEEHINLSAESPLLKLEARVNKYYSFEESLERLYKKTPEEQEEIEKIIGICNDQYDNLKNKKYSKDQLLALISYTYGFQGGSVKPPYIIVNKVLGSRDDNGLYGCGPYILLLLSALRSSVLYPPNKTLYRCISGNHIIMDNYKVGTKRTWPAFTSTSTGTDCLETFASDTSKPVVFEITGEYTGYRIFGLSLNEDEDEVLLEPETTFEVMSIDENYKLDDMECRRIIVRAIKVPLLIEDLVRNYTPGFTGSIRNSSAPQPPLQMQLAKTAQSFTKQKHAPTKLTRTYSTPPTTTTTTTTTAQNDSLPEGWTIEFDPCTGMAYYHNRTYCIYQYNRPTSEHPLCSSPFTCHKVDDLTHANLYRHACPYEASECKMMLDDSHTTTYFHLLKPKCSDKNCTLTEDPNHRFCYAHEGLKAFMTPCKSRTLCDCIYAEDHSHLLEKYHAETKFEYPKEFKYK